MLGEGGQQVRGVRQLVLARIIEPTCKLGSEQVVEEAGVEATA